MQIGAFSLTRSATIVSFDEAKRSSRSARSRAQRADRKAQAPLTSRPLVYFDPGANSRFVTASSRNRRAGAASQPSAPRASASQLSASRSSAARRPAPSWYNGPDERALREETARRAQVRKEAREIEDEEQGKKASPLQKIRRAAAKRKADKVFGAEGAAGASSEGGPRAALYKGEMGSSQRRASRMQDNAPNSAEGAQPRRKKGFSFGPKMRVAAGVVACLALVCVFLYQPAQQYYQAMREHDALAAEYSALQSRGEALQDSVDSLSSDAGIEDLAHDQYGWVKKGEVSVSVSGVENSTDADSSIPPNVAADSVDPPDTWYSGILDPLFGVS